MGFKEVQSLDADVVIALGKKDKNTGKAYPKQIEGYYLGSRKVENKRGESALHFFQTAEGNVGVWGTTDLNRKLSSAPIGAMIRATSTGTKPTPNGEMYTYKVEVDEDNTIEVETLAAGAVTAESEYDSSTNEDDSNENEDEEQTAALVAAERKAKLEAVLNRKSKKN